MLRAMDSAVSGLRAHQNKLDVIGNNIANVNTFGFKSQTYSFKDTMYQTSAPSTRGATDADNAPIIGGNNAAQYGYGALMGSIATDFTSSTPTYVGGLNAAINGSGFFFTNSAYIAEGVNVSETDIEEGAKESPASNNIKQNTFSFTRVGQFTVDANGYIVDANKNFVYGFRPVEGADLASGNVNFDTSTLYALRAPAAGSGEFQDDGSVTVEGDELWGASPMQLMSVEITETGVIRAVIEVVDTDADVDEDAGEAYPRKSVTIELGKVAIAAFQNQEGLQKSGNNTFTTRVGDNTGLVSALEPGKGAAPTLMAGYLESSNTDLAKEFSDMITAERGFQANTKMVTVSDEILQELVNMKR